MVQFEGLILLTIWGVQAFDIPSIDSWTFNSQLAEDATLLHDFFYKKDVGALVNGIFLEVGAVDGIDLSNTLIFEKYLNWTGLLIEGCPEQKEALWKNRPNATKMSKAVCPADKNPREVIFSGCGHSSGIVGAFGDQNTQKHRGDSGRAVPCAPMSEMIKEAGLTHIDLMSIDVEGFELPLLRSIDFSAVSIRVIVIEVNHNSPTELKQIRSLLRSNGFTSRGLCSWAYANELWINHAYHKSTPDLFYPAAWHHPAAAEDRFRLKPCIQPPVDILEMIKNRDQIGDSTGFEEYVKSFQDPLLFPLECKHVAAQAKVTLN